VVVERSGGSLAYAGALLRLFPQARVVHLFRDGRECAVSMSRHGRYKLAMIRAALRARFGCDPYEGHDIPAGQGELAALAPGRITRADYDRFEVPLSRYGGMWSKMIADGLPELPREVLALDYRDLVARPEESIGALLDFLGLDRDPLLEKQMAAGVRPGRDVRGEVGERQWAELTRACRLGMNRLYGRDGWS
jgi:putative sulfotransferase